MNVLNVIHTYLLQVWLKKLILKVLLGKKKKQPVVTSEAFRG